jgi:DNA-directed RNA polymerase subunit RPC12/RpoP
VDFCPLELTEDVTMAQGVTYVCSDCGTSIEAWDEGNPYYRDEKGRKKYAYHPDSEHLALCIGNDADFLCLGCGKKFKVDSEAPIDRCPKCKSTEIVDRYELEGKQCPYCMKGKFGADPNGFVIS